MRGGVAGVLVVNNICRLGVLASFELQPRECIVLQGPSGAGKTVLLRAIADLDPSTGTAALDGIERNAISAPDWRRRVTYVAAEPGWWAETVEDHYGDWCQAVPLVERLGLPARCGAWPIARLSTGERQRLALVRALLIEPRVLLLDEPTAALDPDTEAVVETMLKERLASGTSILWVTHDRAQARRVATRRLLIEDGRVVEAPL